MWDAAKTLLLRATAFYQQCIYVIKRRFNVTVILLCGRLGGKKNGKHNKGNTQGEVCADIRGFLAFKMQPAASHKEH